MGNNLSSIHTYALKDKLSSATEAGFFLMNIP